MKKMNKKGFTIVELVIVIAVIAILAAVMIPTFSNVVSKAQTAAAIQEARNMHAEYVANIEYADGDTAASEVYIIVEDNAEGSADVVVHFAGGTLDDATMTAVPASTSVGAITLPLAGE